MAPPRYLHRHSLVAALAVLLLGSCASHADEPPDTADPASTASTAPAEQETAAPEPVRIVVAGDSLMYDTMPGVTAALDAGAATVVEMVLPTLHAPSSRPQLGRALAEEPTDAVVLMVGVWESGYQTSAGLRVEDPGWAEGYRTEVLDPLVDLISEHESRLVLVHEPPMRSEEATAVIDVVAGAWVQLAADHPERVTYAQAAKWLGEGPTYVEAVVLPDGTQERLRRTDGVHLCREGTVRVVRGILGLVDEIVDPAWEPELVEGWEHGPWTDRFPADECPPVEAPS